MKKEKIQRLVNGLLLASQLKTKILEKGYTYEQFATKLGIKAPNISQWINGDRSIPEKYVKKIKKILDIY